MLVVHAAWLRSGHLALWAEDSTAPALLQRRPGRRPRVQHHPFAADHDALADALGDLASKAATTTVTLSMPGRGGGPVESPELVRDEVPPAGGGAPIMGAWALPALEFDPDAALVVLRELNPDGVALGGSVHLLVNLGRFAIDLVSRGRVLPGVDADGPQAMWRPVLTGPDAAWARSLALASPPAITAEEGAAGRPAVLAAALDALVDAAVRERLDGCRPGQPTGRDPVVRRWLRALAGRERRFAATPESVSLLADSLAAWQSDAVGGPVRACFRLVEPLGGDDDAWRLQFALQAVDEPSLVVDAATVWRSRGALRALARYLDAPQEAFLAELGRASRLYPELEVALRTARPGELALDTAGAHRFLREVAPLLATAGFGVLLPSWWTKPASRLGLRLAAKTPSQPGRVSGEQGTVGYDAIAEYRYDLAIGGEPMSEAELADLAELKAPLVRVRGQWIELDAKRLAAALKVVGSGGTMSVGDLLRIGAGVQQAPGDLPVVAVEGEGWLGELLSGQAEHRLAPVATPAGFHGQLRPYQQRGLAWLDFLDRTCLGGVLADDMGLGKTVQLLALFSREPGDGEPPAPTLLICPMSLVGNWQREAARFTPALLVHVHHGAERARGKHFADAAGASDLVITTYALATRDAAALSKISWARIVVDEAQAIKNAATKQATAIRSLPARSKIAVTGTPVENRLADLWSILEFANPGLLGTASVFKTRYAVPVERHGDADAAERLKRFTGPFILRRLKTDRTIISDLPDKLEMDVLCNLTAEQASLYQAVVDDMLERIATTEGIERRGLVLATMTKLKQVCNHPAQFLRDGTRLAGRSGKLARLEEILDEVLSVGEKALLFTQYAEFGTMMRAHLAGRFGREVLFLHGGVGRAGREDMVARFQSEKPGAPPLFVLSLKAGGTGLTLTAANHVVHVDRWWNPAVEDQATDRAFRIGQRRAVQVRKFVCAGTVEEKIATMIRDKRGLAARIVGSGEQWLTELSTGQLRELFRLEAEAVVE